MNQKKNAGNNSLRKKKKRGEIQRKKKPREPPIQSLISKDERESGGGQSETIKEYREQGNGGPIIPNSAWNCGVRGRRSDEEDCWGKRTSIQGLGLCPAKPSRKGRQASGNPLFWKRVKHPGQKGKYPLNLSLDQKKKERKELISGSGRQDPALRGQVFPQKNNFLAIPDLNQPPSWKKKGQKNGKRKGSKEWKRFFPMGFWSEAIGGNKKKKKKKKPAGASQDRRPEGGGGGVPKGGKRRIKTQQQTKREEKRNKKLVQPGGIFCGTTHRSGRKQTPTEEGMVGAFGTREVPKPGHWAGREFSDTTTLKTKGEGRGEKAYSARKIQGPREESPEKRNL